MSQKNHEPKARLNPDVRRRRREMFRSFMTEAEFAALTGDNKALTKMVESKRPVKGCKPIWEVYQDPQRGVWNRRAVPEGAAPILALESVNRHGRSFGVLAFRPAEAMEIDGVEYPIEIQSSSVMTEEILWAFVQRTLNRVLNPPKSAWDEMFG